MANELRWMPVDAPRLDTRDLAIASQTVDGALGRFTDLLNQRDLRLNKKATDAAAAQVLAANDPAAVLALQQQAAAGALGARVDARQIAALGNERTGQIADQSLAESNLALNQDKQIKAEDFAKHGDTYRQANELAAQGDLTGANALLAQVKAAGGGQSAYDVGLDVNKAFEAHRAYLLDKARTDATVAGEGARTSIMREQANLAKKDRQDLIAGDALGTSLAQSLRVLDPTTAQAKFHESEAYRDMTAPAREQADKSFATAYGQLTGSTGAIDAEFAPTNARVAAVQSGLTAEGNRAKNAQITTLAKATRAAATDQPDLTKQAVVDQLAKMDPTWTSGSTAAQLDKLLTDNPNARLEDVQAALASYATTPSFRHIGFNSNFYGPLSQHIKQITDNRAKGYGQNLELDLAQAVAPSQTKSAEITKLQAEQVRFERALRAGDPAAKTLEARRANAESERRLLNLLQGASK